MPFLTSSRYLFASKGGNEEYLKSTMYLLVAFETDGNVAGVFVGLGVLDDNEFEDELVDDDIEDDVDDIMLDVVVSVLLFAVCCSKYRFVVAITQSFSRRKSNDSISRDSF